MKTVNIDTRAITVALARKQLTRKGICALSGISESYFSAIMRRGTASAKTIGRIAEALGVDVTEIMKQPEE